MKNNDSDVVIVCAKRTPIGKAHRGSFKNTPVDFILSQLMVGCINDSNISPNVIEEIVLGSVLLPSGGVIEARVAALRAGIPVHVSIMTVNRQCASGLESIKIIAERIKSNEIKLGMAGGFEIMSQHGLVSTFNTSIKENDPASSAKACLIPMGVTSEIVAERFDIKREWIDEYAFKSHSRAYKTMHNNGFEDEIINVCNIEGELIENDDGIREPNLVKMKTLKPCFKENGVTTAANASQLSDGCSIIILASRKYANDHNLKIVGRYIDCLSVGFDPSVMGVSPVDAVRKLLKRNNITNEDISRWEINEAFGSQVIYCMKELQIDSGKLNVKGGSIALGHPIGSTGARIVCTLLGSLKKNQYGIASLCAATGIGIAGLFVKE